MIYYNNIVNTTSKKCTSAYLPTHRQVALERDSHKVVR